MKTMTTKEVVEQNNNIEQIIDTVQEIIDFLKFKESEFSNVLNDVHPHYLKSAKNLIHYLGLRTFNLNDMQAKLSMLAISSAAHSEGYIMSNLYNILRLLKLLNGDILPEINGTAQELLNCMDTRKTLLEHTLDLLGDCTRENCTKIMVTMPTEAADNEELINALLREGMDIARINTSHDSAEDWADMIQNIKKGHKITGKPCQIYMDLSGPKLRTDRVFRYKRKKKEKVEKKKGITLFHGDIVCILKDPSTFKVNFYKIKNTKVYPYYVSTTLSEAFEQVKEGDRIFFDDGAIGGIVLDNTIENVIIEITHAGINGSRLKADKGINLPDTELALPSLTEDDLKNIPFIAKNADIIGYSFVRRPKDVRSLQKELKKENREDIGIILKIETKESFENLPKLLLTAMKNPKVGVMIARGDLAVEVGFERIAEVQEEILWICEAANIPVIWATQVLEKLAKTGVASRAEITDAAMSGRAECVMLNKGPYIVDAVKTLVDIIDRMARHQFKRKGNLRPLSVAQKFIRIT